MKASLQGQSSGGRPSHRDEFFTCRSTARDPLGNSQLYLQTMGYTYAKLPLPGSGSL
jgi:hypothetical protein